MGQLADRTDRCNAVPRAIFLSRGEPSGLVTHGPRLRWCMGWNVAAVNNLSICIRRTVESSVAPHELSVIHRLPLPAAAAVAASTVMVCGLLSRYGPVVKQREPWNPADMPPDASRRHYGAALPGSRSRPTLSPCTLLATRAAGDCTWRVRRARSFNVLANSTEQTWTQAPVAKSNELQVQDQLTRTLGGLPPPPAVRENDRYRSVLF